MAAKANLTALTIGRLAAHSAEDLFALADAPVHEPALPRSLAEVTASRMRLLAAWQNQAWANQYRMFIDEIAGVLTLRGLGDCQALLTEVALGLGKLMAYKDEYEVARLYSDPAFKARLADQFAGKVKLRINLGAPYLALGRKDAKTGRPKKVAVPGWIAFPLFLLMAGAKRLRGTPLDLFGYAAERKMERALIGEYRDLMRDVAAKVTGKTMHAAVKLAAAPDLIAGYGPVKDEGVAKFRARVAELLPKLDDARASANLKRPVSA